MLSWILVVGRHTVVDLIKGASPVITISGSQPGGCGPEPHRFVSEEQAKIGVVVRSETAVALRLAPLAQECSIGWARILPQADLEVLCVLLHNPFHNQVNTSPVLTTPGVMTRA